MRIAIDTNRYVDLCKGIAETVELLETADAVMLPFVVLGELRAGFAEGRRPAENEGAEPILDEGPRVGIEKGVRKRCQVYFPRQCVTSSATDLRGK